MPCLVGLLVAAVTADPARPRLTWYDDATGERVELSGATLQTWVAKTAHFLSGELGAGAGSLVSVELPRHWTAAVWWLAVDAVQAQLSTSAGGASGPPDVAVIGPERLEVLPDAGEVVAVSLRPMGAPFTGPLPPFVHDFSLEVRSQPDHFPFPADRDTADGASAGALARHWQLHSHDRVLVVGDVTDRPEPLPELAAPLAAGASVVWVRNPARTVDVQRAIAEQVTAVVDVPDTTDGGSAPRLTPAWPSGVRSLHRPSVF